MGGESRNKVPDNGILEGTISCSNEDAQIILSNLQQLIASVGAEVAVFSTDTQDIQRFVFTFHGVTGHTSKVDTEQDPGMIGVFPDLANVCRALLGETQREPEIQVVTSQPVRVNIGGMVARRTTEGTIGLEAVGEERYPDGNDADLIITNARELLQEYDSEEMLDAEEENKAFSVDPNAESIQIAESALNANEVETEILTGQVSTSDGNNAPEGWHAITLSDATQFPHSHDESVRIADVAKLINIMAYIFSGAYWNK